MGRNVYIKVFHVLLLLVMTHHAKAQDLHFSQFFNSPLSTNPANTGFIPDADYRLGAHYRNQWATFPMPYKTISIYGDAQVFRDRFESGWLGIGGLILRDQAGTGNLISNKIYGSLAYHQMLGVSGLLSAGFNVGVSGKRVNVNSFTFDNQWNGKFFDVTTPSGETFAANNINYPDIQLGINYAWFPTEDMYLHGGFSVHHVNRPRETFFNASPGYDNRLSPRYIGFADAVLKLNDRWIINPSAYFSMQSTATELVGGMHVNYNLSGDGDQQLLAGLYYRSGDAFMPMVGYQWGQFLFMFSYDATQSNMRNFNGMIGATEFYLQHKGNYFSMENLRQSMCPSFK